ncbi:MAG TPA: AI-2E family transporter [Patescibacteria group bacterium]|nr:AI-2E family transporter [Patescibacteria group bacterium]
MKNLRIDISLKTLFSIGLFIAAVYIFLRAIDIVILLMIAFVLMTALEPLVSRLQRLRFSRIAAILVVYVILVGFFVVMGATLIPPLADQTIRLFSQFDLPNLSFLKALTHLQLTATELTGLVSQYGASLGAVLHFVQSTFSVIFSLFTVLVMSLYFLVERDRLYRYAMILFRTDDKEERGRKLVAQIEKDLGGWVRGEFILMLTIGIMTFIGLTVLNIPYALPLSILAGILEALPNIGPTLSAIPAILVASFLVSPIMGVVTLVLYILVQQLENHIIVPQVMRNAVGISPLISIVLLLGGARFGGAIGALLAVPVFIVLRALARELSPELDRLMKG